MNQFNPKIHHRRSIRLKGYDYSQPGLYFITICCQDRAHLFGEIKNGELKLNQFGQIAFNEWLATEIVRPNCKIHDFIIMPNHIHGIIEIKFNKGNPELIGKFYSPSQTIGSFIRGFKIAVIKKINDKIIEFDNNKVSRVELQFAPNEISIKKIKKFNFKIWQRDYYENIIRNEQSFHRISDYIINNPKNWKEDRFG